MYDKLIGKASNIDASEFVLKTKYNTDKSDLEKKISDAGKTIPDTNGLGKKKKKKPQIIMLKVLR